MEDESRYRIDPINVWINAAFFCTKNEQKDDQN